MVRKVAPEIVVGFTHPSMVNAFVVRNERLSGTRTPFVVMLNAWPTLPEANATERNGRPPNSPEEPKSSKPSFESQPSNKIVSARHQLTRPLVTVTHGGAGRTVSSAFELKTEPAALAARRE